MFTVGSFIANQILDRQSFTRTVKQPLLVDDFKQAYSTQPSPVEPVEIRQVEEDQAVEQLEHSRTPPHTRTFSLDEPISTTISTMMSSEQGAKYEADKPAQKTEGSTTEHHKRPREDESEAKMDYDVSSIGVVGLICELLD